MITKGTLDRLFRNKDGDVIIEFRPSAFAGSSLAYELPSVMCVKFNYDERDTLTIKDIWTPEGGSYPMISPAEKYTLISILRTNFPPENLKTIPYDSSK